MEIIPVVKTFFACLFCFPNTNHVTILRRFELLTCSLKDRVRAWKHPLSWVSSHDLYWENEIDSEKGLVFTKSVDSNFSAFERREKWRVVSRKFQKKKLKKRFFYPSDLVNTKATIPLTVGEERWIYTSTLRVSVYIHHYSSPLRGIVVYYYSISFSPFVAIASNFGN